MDELKEDYPQQHLDLHTKKENKFQRIICPSCASNIPAKDLNINDKIAKCVSCNAVFSFEENILSMLQGSPRQELIRPEGIDIFYFQDEMDITIQQPVTMLESIILMIAPVFTLLFTLAFFKEKMPMFMPGIFWVLTILTLASLVFRKRHKIYVQVDEEELSIAWRPRKLVRDRKYNSKDIDQLYINKGMESFQVNMILNTNEGQKHVLLLGGLKSISKAKYLEQELERHLKIGDRKVPEELS